jgi:hypothetical protein
VNEVVSFMHDVPLSAGGDLLLVGTVGLGNAPSTSTQPRADDVAGTVRILNRCGAVYPSPDGRSLVSTTQERYRSR